MESLKMGFPVTLIWAIFFTLKGNGEITWWTLTGQIIDSEDLTFIRQGYLT